MIMKRIIVSIAVSLLTFTAFAQAEKYEQRYNMLVAKLGYDGVGVETLLDNWEKADSTDSKMLLGRFNYYFTKSQSGQIVSKPTKKYLGMDPLFTLKDSTGTDVFYYQEIQYDDDMYAKAIMAADKAIGIYAEKLDFRFVKANAYIAYEKHSPDMALAYLLSLVEESRTRKVWLYGEEQADSKFFSESMLEYCYSFYSIGTPQAMEAFVTLSRRMTELYPDNMDFLNNIGSYYMISKEDYKSALKQYSKALKKQPDDYTAIRNSVLAARRLNNPKLEVKYLRMLVQYGPDKEKVIAEGRLRALEAKK